MNSPLKQKTSYIALSNDSRMTTGFFQILIPNNNFGLKISDSTTITVERGGSLKLYKSYAFNFSGKVYSLFEETPFLSLDMIDVSLV